MTFEGLNRRRVAGLALSLAVHGALLAIFMSVRPRLVVLPRSPSPRAPVVELDLRPASGAPAPRALRRSDPSSATAVAASRAVPTPAPPPSLRPSRSAPFPATASPPQGGPVTPGAQGAVGERWRVQGGGGDASAAARALIRGTIGCAAVEFVHLTAEERDHCYAELVRGMRTLKPDAIPPEKRAYYDQVVAAYAKMHAPTPMARAALGDNFGLASRWDAPAGAHPPAVGCSISFGKPSGWKTYANRANPPHAFKLGPLPCYVYPPSGLGTEEADVPPPASLRERQDDDAHAAKFAPAVPPPS